VSLGSGSERRTGRPYNDDEPPPKGAFWVLDRAVPASGLELTLDQVPQVAVQELQGLHQVYVAGSDNKAHLTTVQLGPQVGASWLLDGGIAPGALVIVDNLQKLRDGAPVNPHRGPAAPAATNPAGS